MVDCREGSLTLPYNEFAERCKKYNLPFLLY